jgi:hypothetical protein
MGIFMSIIFIVKKKKNIVWPKHNKQQSNEIDILADKHLL